MNKRFILVLCLFFSQSLLCDFFINPEKMNLLNYVFMNDGNYIDITINNRRFAGNRPWDIRWDIIKKAYDYTDLKVLDLGCFLGINSICIKKYGYAQSVTGVDYTRNHLQQAGILAQAFEVDNVQFLYANFNDLTTQYEDLLGHDYDFVFCMSVIHWVKEKERLLNYLSHFKRLIFEGHELAEVEIERFKPYGFDAKILGYAENGRALIFFFKD